MRMARNPKQVSDSPNYREAFAVLAPEAKPKVKAASAQIVKLAPKVHDHKGVEADAVDLLGGGDKGKVRLEEIRQKGRQVEYEDVSTGVAQP